MTMIDFKTAMERAKTVSFEPLPDGTYDVICLTAESTTTSTGKPMIKARWQVETGPHAGSKIFDQYVFSADNDNALSFFFQHMRFFGLDEAFFSSISDMEQIAVALPGRRCRMQLSTRIYEGRPTNDVQKIMPPSTPNAAAAPGATIPGIAPAVQVPGAVPSMPVVMTPPVDAVVQPQVAAPQVPQPQVAPPQVVPQPVQPVVAQPVVAQPVAQPVEQPQVFPQQPVVPQPQVAPQPQYQPQPEVVQQPAVAPQPQMPPMPAVPQYQPQAVPGDPNVAVQPQVPQPQPQPVDPQQAPPATPEEPF
jgi:hypothetical protein